LEECVELSRDRLRDDGDNSWCRRFYYAIMEAIHTTETGATQNVIICAFRAKILNVNVLCTVSQRDVRMSLLNGIYCTISKLLHESSA
jgi:hypothetical protein